MRYITIQQAAEVAGLSPKSLRKAVTRGRLRVEVVNPRLNLTTRAWLQDYLASRRPGGPRPALRSKP